MSEIRKCSKRVRDEDGWSSHDCRLSVTVERGGKPYCKIHDPVYVKEKADKRDAKWVEESNARAKKYALEKSAPDLVKVAEAYEAWEADLILNGDWSGQAVRMNQDQYDRMLEIQGMRNAALAKARGES